MLSSLISLYTFLIIGCLIRYNILFCRSIDYTCVSALNCLNIDNFGLELPSRKLCIDYLQILYWNEGNSLPLVSNNASKVLIIADSISDQQIRRVSHSFIKFSSIFFQNSTHLPFYPRQNAFKLEKSHLKQRIQAHLLERKGYNLLPLNMICLIVDMEKYSTMILNDFIVNLYKQEFNDWELIILTKKMYASYELFNAKNIKLVMNYYSYHESILANLFCSLYSTHFVVTDKRILDLVHDNTFLLHQTRITSPYRILSRTTYSLKLLKKECFDSEFYVSKYPESAYDPYSHYINYGSLEHRLCNLINGCDNVDINIVKPCNKLMVRNVVGTNSKILDDKKISVLKHQWISYIWNGLVNNNDCVTFEWPKSSVIIFKMYYSSKSFSKLRLLEDQICFRLNGPKSSTCIDVDEINTSYYNKNIQPQLAENMGIIAIFAMLMKECFNAEIKWFGFTSWREHERIDHKNSIYTNWRMIKNRYINKNNSNSIIAFPSTLPNVFRVSNLYEYSENSHPSITNFLSRVFKKALNIDKLPYLPTINHGLWIFHNYWIMPANSLKAFGRFLMLMLTAMIELNPTPWNHCPFRNVPAPYTALIDYYCYAFILERLVNIWSYHTGRSVLMFFNDSKLNVFENYYDTNRIEKKLSDGYINILYQKEKNRQSKLTKQS